MGIRIRKLIKELEQEVQACHNEAIAWERAMMAAIGEDGIKSVSAAIAKLKAERDALKAQQANIVEHATHAARSQLCRELADRYDSDQLVTVEQITDLLSPWTPEKPQ